MGAVRVGDMGKPIRINPQQFKKEERILSTFVADEGCTLIDTDFCLVAHAELLTQSGWKLVNELTETDQVWQVDPDTLLGSWCNPKRVIWKEYNGPMYRFSSVRGTLDVTYGHTMIWFNQLTRPRPRSHKIAPAQCGIPSKYHSTLLTSSYRNTQSDYTLQEIWIACMLQADGSITNKTYRLEVALPRKREKVRELLGRPGLLSAARDNQNLESESWNGICFTSPLLDGKEFNLSSLGSNQAADFLEALSFWDGSHNHDRIVYSSTNEHNIDEVQGYFVRCGYECRKTLRYKGNDKHKPCWELRIGSQKGVRLTFKNTTVYDYSGMVGCVTVDTGFILVRQDGQTFITGNCAVEPKVQAIFSGDKSMWELYGTGKKHDIYLFNGQFIEPDSKLRTRLRQVYPAAVESGTLSTVKEEFAHRRGKIYKPTTLSASYGAQAERWQIILAREGIQLPIETVRDMRQSYTDAYSGLHDWNKRLLREWKLNGGWITTGLGRPRCVSPDVLKDLISVFTQTTAHDVLLWYTKILYDLVKERGVRMRPWIDDFHDQHIAQCVTEDTAAAVQCFEDAYQILNEQLQWAIPITGEVTTGTNLWEFKQ